MLRLSRRVGESLLIYPSLDVDPDMTVAELFKDGPMRIKCTRASGGQARLAIDASKLLAIAQTELEVT